MADEDPAVAIGSCCGRRRPCLFAAGCRRDCFGKIGRTPPPSPRLPRQPFSRVLYHRLLCTSCNDGDPLLSDSMGKKVHYYRVKYLYGDAFQNILAVVLKELAVMLYADQVRTSHIYLVHPLVSDAAVLPYAQTRLILTGFVFVYACKVGCVRVDTFKACNF